MIGDGRSLSPHASSLILRAYFTGLFAMYLSVRAPGKSAKILLETPGNLLEFGFSKLLDTL